MPEEAGSGEAEAREDQKVGKRGSLMRCQTDARGAGMTADSVMEGAVGGGAIFGVWFRRKRGLVCGGWVLDRRLRDWELLRFGAAEV